MPFSQPPSALFNSFKFEYKITLGYLVFGFIWILFSDKILDSLIEDHDLLLKLQIFKGFFFVTVTSLLLFLFVKRHMNQLRLVETQRNESEYRFTKLYENSPFGMVLSDKSFVFLKVNPSFCRMLGYDEPEFKQMTFRDITHPVDAQRDLVNVAKLMNKEVDVYRTEKRYLRKDGSIMWGSLTVTSIYNSNGGFLYNLGVVEDITLRKEAEAEVAQLNATLEQRIVQRTAQLEEANKELEAFSYSVSHDLRAPLRHINGYVELLNERYRENLPDKALHYLNTVTDAAKQMGKLIDDLLQLSRTGRQELRQSKVDLNGLVKEVIEKIEEDFPTRRIGWSIHELPLVFGDYALLKQVWVNLVENAVKYTRLKEKAEIIVGFKDEKDAYVFYIGDNGVGFDMKYAHKLFGVFQRLHTQSEFEGTGVGLANVKRIVNKHNGSVWVDATPDLGATFYFSLPKK